MELHKRRKALTEPEVRCLFRQTVLAVSYLHSVKVIIIIIISMIIERGKLKIMTPIGYYYFFSLLLVIGYSS